MFALMIGVKRTVMVYEYHLNQYCVNVVQTSHPLADRSSQRLLREVS